MSVKDCNMSIIITSALTGKVIDVLPYDLYRKDTLDLLFNDIINSYIYENQEGILIKFGNTL